MSDISHFICTKCWRVASLPWEQAWCWHQDSLFTPRPPSGEYIDDEKPATCMEKIKMLKVTTYDGNSYTTWWAEDWGGPV